MGEREPGELFVREVRLERARVPGFDRYPFALRAIRSLETLPFTAPVTFFIGENGTGKSTLLEAIAIAAGFNPEGGSQNMRFETRSTHSELHDAVRLIRGTRRMRTGYFLRAESFYNVASEIDRLDALGPVPLVDSYGGRSLHAQSHGESFMNLVMHRFSGEGLYILDEPEAALSPTRQLALLVRIRELVDGGAQFIIATHSPIVLGLPGATIHEFSDSGIAVVSYEDTEHYIITRRFLLDREGMLRRLHLDGG